MPAISFLRQRGGSIGRGVTSSAQESDEWVGSCAQIEAAIAVGPAKPLGWYFRDLGDFLRCLAPALAAPEGATGWRLKFVREGRGRRSDPVQQVCGLNFCIQITNENPSCWKAVGCY